MKRLTLKLSFLLTLLIFTYGASIAQGSCGTTITAPYLEDFEGLSRTGNGTQFENCWTRPVNGFNGTWLSDANGTPSSNTGPEVFISGSESYMFYESSGTSFGDEATLTSPPIDLSALPNPKVSFFYHMYGFSMGELNSEISSDNGATWTNMWTLSGVQQFSGFDPWREATYDLSAFSGQTILHRFRTVAAGSYAGDMAVDDFSVINDDSIPTEPEPVPGLGYWGLILIALSLLTIVSVFLYRQ